MNKQAFVVLVDGSIVTEVRLSIPSLDYYNDRDQRLMDVLKSTCSFNHGNRTKNGVRYQVLDFDVTVVGGDVEVVLSWFAYTFYAIFPKSQFELFFNERLFKLN